MRKFIDLKQHSALEKECLKLEKEEARRRTQAFRKSNTDVKDKIEEKIPPKVYETLQKAFAKSFEIVFEKGVGIIEKTYDKEELLKNYEIDHFAIQKKGSRKEFKTLHSHAKVSGRVNMLLSTVEGTLLGILGIGMPDIVLFTGMLLKGAYETALHYGYDYDSDAERYLILLLLEGALAKEDTYVEMEKGINKILANGSLSTPTKDILQEQIVQTSNAMAADMLVMKFVQGLPLVGLVGGITNPIYYNKIIGYIQLKYRKRYLLDQRK